MPFGVYTTKGNCGQLDPFANHNLPSLRSRDGVDVVERVPADWMVANRELDALFPGSFLVVNHYQGAGATHCVPHLSVTRGQRGGRPVKQPLGVGGSEVDAPVAPGPAKIIVPVGSVDGVCSVKVHDVRYARLFIVWTNHGLREQFAKDAEAPEHGGRLGGPRGNRGTKHDDVSFIGG